MINNPEHAEKTAQEQSLNSHLISTQESRFSVTEDKTGGRKTQKQAAAEGGCCEGLEKHLLRIISQPADVHELHTSGSHGL